MSADGENEFFCDGITEEIINALAKIQQLKVISRTSSFYFKNHKAPISEIGEQLNVSVILEGSVRIHGNILRITAQLINVEDDSHFWSETWDRKTENIFAIQDEISLLIADKLREHVGHLDISDHLVEPHTQNPSAYEHYLKGYFHFYKWNPEDTNIAIEEFEMALALDDKLVDAYVGLADSYSFMAVAGFAPREEAWMKAVHSMNIARKLDPDHAGLNYMLGNQAFFTEANYTGAMQYAQRALTSKPTHPDSQRFMSFLCALRGDMKKSYEHILFVKSIDPLNQETRFFEAYYYYKAGNFAKASAMIQDLLRENPKNLPALIVNIYILIINQQYAEAKAIVEGLKEGMTPDEKLGLICLIEVSNGTPNDELIEKLEQSAEAPSAHHAHSYLFLVYVVLGRFDDAFKILDKLFEVKSSVLLLSFSDPMAARLQTDKRYADYHKRIYPVKEADDKQSTSNTTLLNAEKAAEFLAKLNDFIHSEKPYLNPSLSLRLLADQIEIHPNQLSWLLNEHIGKNFNEYINLLRIDHFKELVIDPSNAHISLIGLAYESGFNSKTVFNTAFKKAVGMTPKEYQKSH